MSQINEYEDMDMDNHSQAEDSDADSDSVGARSARDQQIAKNRGEKFKEAKWLTQHHKYEEEKEERECNPEVHKHNIQTQRNILQKDDTDFSQILDVPQSGNEAHDNQQKIDFDQQLQAYKERTEMTLPYVATQVEDAMYLNQQHVVTLEYHYFQNDCIYSPLEEVDQTDSNLSEKEKDIFGTKDFGKDGQIPSSQFQYGKDEWLNDQRNIISYHESGRRNQNVQELQSVEESNRWTNDKKDTHNPLYNCFQRVHEIQMYDHRMHGDVHDAFQTNIKAAFSKKQEGQHKKELANCKDEKHMYNLGIIGLYKVAPSGGLKRLDECPIKMGNRNFYPSRDGNMTLTRSYDKRLISLLNFSQYNEEKNYFQLKAWTTKLDPWAVSEELNKGLNDYYMKYMKKGGGIEQQQHQNHFNKLISVTFAGRCSMVELVYLEEQPRSQEEQKNYQANIEEKYEINNVDEKLKKDISNIKVRTAKKYVYFDSQTGAVKFEYGGVADYTKTQVNDWKPMLTKEDGTQFEAYELGLLVKETREDYKGEADHHEYFHFYIMGDFFTEDIKSHQPILNWTLIDLEIEQTDILNIQGADPYSDEIKEKQRKYLIQRLVDAMPTPNKVLSHVHYLVDPCIVTLSKFNWENNISIAANRLFDQFAIIDNPHILGPKQMVTYYVNGIHFKKQEDQLNHPYYIKINHDCFLQHGRNSYVKNELFYTLFKRATNERQTILVKTTDYDACKCVSQNIRLDNSNILSQHDAWLQQKRNFNDNSLIDIYQTISVNIGDQYALLQTRVPWTYVGSTPSEYHVVRRNTNQFEQQAVNCPFIAYNLGDSKVLIQNVQQKGGHKIFILDMPKNERFESFVSFQSYGDIGFDPAGLNIELCSHFLFVTHDKNNHKKLANRLNLLLLDPFSGPKNQLQAVMFRSSTYFDNDFIKANDFVVQTIVQSSKKRNDDKNYKIYLWTQLPNKLIRSKMLTPSNLRFVEDSDQTDEEEANKQNQDQDYMRLRNEVQYEKIPLIQDAQGFMYYIIQKNGESTILEGNPKDPYQEHHVSIYDLKVNKIMAFNGDGDNFQLMDSNYVVYNLSRQRNKGERRLTLINEQTLKDIQQLEYIPEDYDPQYLSNRYSIFRSKIFYFHPALGDPFPEGIMEAEDLIDKKSEKSDGKQYWMRGPFKFEGSNRFYNVYRQNKFRTFVKIYYLPDSTERTLINDYLNGVDMSTFLQNGKVLLKIFHQFLIFDQKGKFINKVNIQPYEDLCQKDKVLQQCVEFSKQHTHTTQENENSKIDKSASKIHINKKFKDFEGNYYNPVQDSTNPKEHLVDNKDADEFKKLELINFDFTNRFFLFLDKTKGNEKLLMFELKTYNNDSGSDGTPPASKPSGPKFLQKLNNTQQKTKAFGLEPEDQQAKPEIIDEEYSFVFLYQLTVGDSNLWKHQVYNNQNHNITKKIDLVTYFRNNHDQVKIDKNATVMMCYVEIKKDNNQKRKSNTMEDTKECDDCRQEASTHELPCLIRGAIFKQPNKSDGQNKYISKCKNFQQNFNFPQDSQEKLENILENRMKEINQKIEHIKLIQKRLPKALHNYNEYDNLIQDYFNLQSQKGNQTIYAKYYYDDLIILYCGNYLKYGRLVKNKDKTYSGEHFQFKELKDGERLIDIDCIFDEQVEIIKLIETVQNDCVQIVNKNYEQNIVTVVAWDFVTNSEKSCYQLMPDVKSKIQQHVVKGLNYKLNYFYNQDYIIDLETSIPIKQKNVMQFVDHARTSYRKQLKNINDYYNQRKINHDQQKILGVEKAHCMYYNLSRMDIKLWENIFRTGEKLEIIQQSVTLDDFNQTFNGMSLFHYFSPRAEVLELVLTHFDKAKTHEKITKTQKTLPLQILNRDLNGNTALTLSITNQSPRAFEIMIEMLKDFPEVCVTKMMLDCMFMILDHQSPKVLDFLDNCLFAPPQMQLEQFIPWPEEENLKEIIFPCHTSIVSNKLLLKAIEDEMELPFPLSYLGFKNVFSQKIEDQGESHDYDQNDVLLNVLLDSEDEKVTYGNITNLTQPKLREYELNENPSKQFSKVRQNLKRVQVQAIDMDWLFEKNNAEDLIEIISKCQSTDALTKKPIKLFVNMMWTRFQPRIVWMVFLPYILYLSLLYYLSGYVVNRFMISREKILFMHEFAKLSFDPKDHDSVLTDVSTTEEHINLLKIHQQNKIYATAFTSATLLLIVFFGIIELRQLKESSWRYFIDPWNVIDMTSLCLNFSFISMFFICVVYDRIFFSREEILSIGSWGMFFMWIKVFYWFRLFPSYAYYVRLIIKTMYDFRKFMALVLVILISFGNFVYVADETMSGTKNSYAVEFFGIKTLDAVVSLYMMGALQNFSVDQYSVGYEKQSMMTVWILATFIVSVIFMNMLIAIMSNTFQEVLANAEAAGLNEQVILMGDHVWLTDTKALFAGKKYIMRVAPYESRKDNVDKTGQHIEEIGNFLHKKIGDRSNKVLQRMNIIENNTRFKLDLQYNSIDHMITKLNQASNEVESLNDKTRENKNENHGHRSKINQKTLHRNQSELGQVLLEYIGKKQMDEKVLRKTVMEWVEVMDTNQSGVIDYEEFYKFFSNLDELPLNDNQIASMFREFDTSNDQHISVEEFATAMVNACEIYNNEGEIQDDNIYSKLDSLPGGQR